MIILDFLIIVLHHLLQLKLFHQITVKFYQSSKRIYEIAVWMFLHFTIYPLIQSTYFFICHIFILFSFDALIHPSSILVHNKLLFFVKKVTVSSRFSKWVSGPRNTRVATAYCQGHVPERVASATRSQSRRSCNFARE